MAEYDCGYARVLSDRELTGKELSEVLRKFSTQVKKAEEKEEKA